jgi:hypothetical protein
MPDMGGAPAWRSAHFFSREELKTVALSKNIFCVAMRTRNIRKVRKPFSNWLVLEPPPGGRESKRNERLFRLF